MPYYSATRGLLATNLIILSLCQVMRMTSELAPSSPNYHITHSASTDLTCIGPLYMAGLQRYKAQTHDTLATSLP
ncbi:hypothetical protein TNCV_3369851 [Trichonephila clavipes]|uniref:Secreted protein n=1 Tax=Trichonephila clavipes TaxID=2585209 RepID=A0A8X6R2Y2_TRICX|nr:hypothetical protein TNCV_3369851 [Trichonephila clavipes]